MSVFNLAMDYKNNNFGKAIPIEMTKDNREDFATVFSEGSESLKNLLLYLWDKDVETVACCTGHICKPLFKKKILWTETYISEREYQKNMHKKGYRVVWNDTPGYVYFKYTYDNMYHAAHTLQIAINKKSPVPATIMWSENSLSIHMEYPASPLISEQFFQTVLDVFPSWEASLR